MLAGRLAAIVPEGFYAGASGGLLWYSADHGRFPGRLGDYQAGTSGTGVAADFGAHGQAAGERVAGVAAQAPGELPGYAGEAAHGPWPGERTPPQADAQVRDAVLRLWYGEPGAGGRVVLRCDPVPLAGIQPGG